LRTLLSVLVASSYVSGCGLQVPRMGEFYETPTDAGLRLNIIESQIGCQIKEAVQNVFYVDTISAARNNESPKLGWLATWGGQATLSVTIDEQTSLNPGVSFRTPMHSAITNFKGEYLAPSGSLLSTMTYPLLSTPQSYSFGIGGTASSEASVDDSSDFSVLFKPLLTGKNWDDYFRKRSGNQDTSCKNISNVLIEGDLGLNDWLEDRLLPVMLGNVSAPKTSVQRHLFFKVVTNGNIAPTWTLVRVSTPSTPLASAGRTRTYDLIVTLGPQAKPGDEGQCCKKPKPKGEETFTPTAANQSLHSAAQIGVAVSRSLAQ
jgi:hypothetical protein